MRVCGRRRCVVVGASSSSSSFPARNSFLLFSALCRCLSVHSILTDENAMTDVVLQFANNPCCVLYFCYMCICYPDVTESL